MDHAITVGQVLWFVGGCLAVMGVLGVLFFVIDLLNPFRSGH